MAVPAWYKVYQSWRKFASATYDDGTIPNLGTEVHEITGYDHISAFWLHVTAITGTLASVIVTVQTSIDGLLWVDGDSSAAIVVAGGAIDVKITATMDYHRFIRLKTAVDDTDTPSITYECYYGFDRLSQGLPKAA